jgi:hypothetical protein
MIPLFMTNDLSFPLHHLGHNELLLLHFGRDIMHYFRLGIGFHE